jgi:ATP-dependent Lon protease
VVVFPHMVIPLFVGRPKSIKALEVAMEAERRIMLVAQKAAAKDEPSVADMFDVGCVSTILQMLKLPDGTVKVLVEGQQRARVARIEEGESRISPPTWCRLVAGGRALKDQRDRGPAPRRDAAV